ncbi:hypothetical protein ACFLIN_03695 [Corynebacterium kutscheri]|uniref:hypothetical protein n=1 Tax=Corynebacterium kutscheri TaxID=35755 RepID=UPI0037BE52B6
MPIDRLPARFYPVAYRVRGFLMTDATALIVMGVASLVRGVSYLPVFMPPPRITSHPVEGTIPVEGWALVWIAISVLCLTAAVTHLPVLDATAIGLGIGLHVMWGLSFITSTLVDGSPRAWTSSIGMLSTAALVSWAVWRGKRGDIDDRGQVDGG